MALSGDVRQRYLMVIDGEQVEGGGGFRPVINPAVNKELTQVAVANREDVDRAVAAARKAFTGDWAKFGPVERSRVLLKFSDLIRENTDELARLETLNVGKAIAGAKAEVRGAANELEFFASHTRLTGETLPGSGSMFSYTTRQPVGVCAAIVPWNFPILMAAWKIGPALAAGCTLVLKPATATPLTAIRLAELALEAGIPPGVLNVVVGPGTEVGAYLVSHPGVDKVAFTGETTTGREIMKMAADGIKRVTLELGGKSPNVIFDDADLEGAAAASVWAIYYNAGQTCEARSRLIIHEKVYDKFLDLFTEKARKVRIGDPLDPETQVGSLVSTSQWQRVDGYVKSGLEEGAKLLCGGRRPEGLPEPYAQGAFYEPTVLADVGIKMRVAQEEIFGPVVTATPFKDEAEAIALANDVIYGLAGTVFTRDGARAQRVARSIKAGTVGINTPFISFPGIPFGGFKQSGIGRERASQTLDQYTETHTILINISDRIYNPYGL